MTTAPPTTPAAVRRVEPSPETSPAAKATITTDNAPLDNYADKPNPGLQRFYVKSRDILKELYQSPLDAAWRYKGMVEERLWDHVSPARRSESEQLRAHLERVAASQKPKNAMRLVWDSVASHTAVVYTSLWDRSAKQKADSSGLTRHTPQSVSFAGSCFLGVYGLGAAMAFDDLGHPFEMFGGASIGILTASGLAGKCDMEAGKQYTYDMLVKLRENPLPLFWRTNELMGEFIDMNSYPEAFEENNGRVFVSVTRVFPYIRNEIHHQYQSTEDMKQHVIASCWLPGLMGFKPYYLASRNNYFIDGGFTNNLPRWDEHTVTVSPFSWYDGATIGPANYVPVQYTLLPPDEDTTDELWTEGWNEGEKWLMNHD